MTDRLTLYPFEPIEIKSGLTTFNISDRELFWKVVSGLQNVDDTIIFSADYQKLDYSKSLIFVGDLCNFVSPKEFFMKKIFTRIENIISDENKHKIFILDREIRNILSEEVFDLGLPIELNTDWSLNDIIKMVGIKYNKKISDDPRVLIGDYIDLSYCLDDKRFLIFTNLINYFDSTSLKKVSYECKSKGVKLISFNLSDDGINYEDDNEEICFIDKDFIQFVK